MTNKSITKKPKAKSNKKISKDLNLTGLIDKKSQSGYRLISDSEIGDFINILKVLQKYYELHPPANSPTHSFLFRQKLIDLHKEDFYVLIKKFGIYEYLLSAVISSTGEKEDWIHVDGIAGEREQQRCNGVTSHPVFDIKCLGDIYENCPPASEALIKSLEKFTSNGEKQ